LAGDLSFCFDDVPVGSGKILNISAKLTARVIMLSRSNRPNLENINHFCFVLPNTQLIVVARSIATEPQEGNALARRPSHRNHTLENYLAASIASAAVTRARWRLAFVPHRKPGSQTCAATTHVVRSDP
jgi:hypothetical protein